MVISTIFEDHYLCLAGVYFVLLVFTLSCWCLLCLAGVYFVLLVFTFKFQVVQ